MRKIIVSNPLITVIILIVITPLKAFLPQLSEQLDYSSLIKQEELYCVPVQEVILTNETALENDMIITDETLSAKGKDEGKQQKKIISKGTIIEQNTLVKRNPTDGKVQLKWNSQTVSFDLSDHIIKNQSLPVFINESKERTPSEQLFTAKGSDSDYKENLTKKNLLYCVLVTVSPAQTKDSTKFVSGTLEKILQKYKTLYVYKGTKNIFPTNALESYYKVRISSQNIQTVTDMKQVH
jgi:hypothetical protein